MECAKCEISGNRTKLLDVISDKGIIKLCRKCADEMNFPVVKKPAEFDFDFREEEPRQSVYERLSKMSGYDKSNSQLNSDIQSRKIPETQLTSEQKQKNTELKKIVDESVLDIPKKEKPMQDLVDNFHWIIMRVRRRKKLTREQFAREINEPESVVKMAEQGFISQKNPELVNKIENYLGIRIRKKKSGFPYTDVQQEKIKENIEKEFTPEKEVSFQKNSNEGISFDPAETRNLKIADLKRLKREKEQKEFSKRAGLFDEDFEESLSGENKENKKEKPFDEQELTDKELDDILFGRK